MKILSTLMLSSMLAVGGTALAAKDPDRVTGKDRAAQAGTDREARMAERERNANAATPAMPYPGEGKAATPAVPAKKRTDDTTTSGTGTTTTGTDSGSTTGTASGNVSGRSSTRTTK
jgi:hypothetical protein